MNALYTADAENTVYRRNFTPCPTLEQLEHKLAELASALRQSELQYRQLIEAMGGVIYKVSPSGYVTAYGPAAAGLPLGYAEHELVGKFAFSFVDAAYRKSLIAFYQTMIQHRRQRTYTEFPVITKEGRTIWIGQSVQLVEAGEQLIELVVVAHDVTEKHLFQEQVWQTEEKYRSMLNNLLSTLLEGQGAIPALELDGHIPVGGPGKQKDIFVKVEGRYIRLDYDRILYLENTGDYVKVVTTAQTYLLYGTMKLLEEKLGPTFMRVHRSFIVNLEKIMALEESALLIGNRVIPISRSNRAELMNRLNFF